MIGVTRGRDGSQHPDGKREHTHFKVCLQIIRAVVADQ